MFTLSLLLTIDPKSKVMSLDVRIFATFTVFAFFSMSNIGPVFSDRLGDVIGLSYPIYVCTCPKRRQICRHTDNNDV